MNICSIFSYQSLWEARDILLELCKTFFFFKIKQEHFLGTLSSCKVSLNRRILIKKKEEIQAFSIFLETVLSRKLSVSWGLSDHLLPNGVLSSHDPKGDSLQDCGSVYITFENSNSGIVFKIYYKKFVMAGYMLNRLCVIFSTASLA